ncbi:MAG: CRISPR-associated protein Cas4 [Chloroflexales bacterium]
MSPLVVTLLTLAVATLILALRIRARTGVPWAPIIANDARAGRTGQHMDRPLVARHYGLSGKPDYIIDQRGQQIPVEVKPGRYAAQPYDSDRMQLAAYCLLIEETSGHAPPYGILRYAEVSFRLPYTAEVRAEILAILDEMHELLDAEDVMRSHSNTRRCAGCGFVAHCEESLA